MNKIKIIVIAIISFFAIQGYGQYSPCGGGSDNPPQVPTGEQETNPSAEGNTSVYTPSDPNEIIGTRGYDALGDTLQWVAATASLPYTIYFENNPELATAAAQKVEVRHGLHAKADISTFAIGAFGFGSHVFTVEGNRSSYQQRLDLTQDMGIYVDVVAGIDIVVGEAFWILQSIDPVTGLPPQGTQQGFLPVNDENHSGEGYVSFTIKPKANACITGDELTASASIVFDINEAIPTNVWHNTVDALPPTTQLTGTDNGNNEVLLQFSGQDDEGGCGIKQYKLYVSDNYGAYSLYDTYPVGSEATFPTEYDHCYRFFCLGEDNVGNVEGKKEEAEMEYEGAAMAQSNYLSQGWNWWSTYIEQSNIDGLSMLEQSLGHKGVTIKSQFDFVQNFYSDYGEDAYKPSDNLTTELELDRLSCRFSSKCCFCIVRFQCFARRPYQKPIRVLHLLRRIRMVPRRPCDESRRRLSLLFQCDRKPTSDVQQQQQRCPTRKNGQPYVEDQRPFLCRQSQHHGCGVH